MFWKTLCVTVCSWGKTVCDIMCVYVLEATSRYPIHEIECTLTDSLVVVRK